MAGHLAWLAVLFTICIIFILVSFPDSSMVYSNVGLPAVRRLRQYSKESMAAAIEAVRSGRMRKSQAAQFYGVPRTTLLDKLSGRTPEEYHSPCFRRVYNYMRTPSSRDAKGSTDQDQKKLETSMQEQTNSPIKPESSVQEQSNIASQDAKVNPGKDQIKCEDFMQEQMNSGDSD